MPRLSEAYELGTQSAGLLFGVYRDEEHLERMKHMRFDDMVKSFDEERVKVKTIYKTYGVLEKLAFRCGDITTRMIFYGNRHNDRLADDW